MHSLNTCGQMQEVQLRRKDSGIEIKTVLLGSYESPVESDL